jgi:excisionase family DNA binding protein
MWSCVGTGRYDGAWGWAGVTTMTDEQLLTTEQVAERLQISEWTLRDWLRTGKLRGIRLGSKRAGWRIRASEIERFLREQEGASPLE